MSVNAEPKKAPGLQRTIGLMAAVNIIISVMIGSGIFVSPTAALRYSGSVGFCLVVWTACGFVSLLGALCFAELGTVVPRSGAEYAYLFEAFAKRNKFWGPLPAFLLSWVFVLVLRPAEIAVIVLTFAEYSIQPLMPILGMTEMSLDDQQKVIKLIALLGLGIITYINLSSVKLYVRINNIFSVCKVIACLIVIAGGIYQLAIGKTENLQSGFKGTTTNIGHVALAFYNGLWAYDGWSSVTTVTEEIKHPDKNIPRSIMIAVPIITGLYVFMNLAYMTVLTPSEMMSAPAVAVEFGNRILGPMAFIIPLGVALSTFGCALSVQFGVTRLCFVAGREGHFLEPMSYVHVRKSTPGPAVALQSCTTLNVLAGRTMYMQDVLVIHTSCKYIVRRARLSKMGIITLMFIVVGDIEALIEFASFLIWVAYGSAFVSLLVLRRTHPDIPRPYKVPIVIPIFALMVAIFLSVMPIISEPSFKYLAALAFILSGIAVYTPFVYHKIRPRWMNKFTYLLQVLFEAAPPPKEL